MESEKSYAFQIVKAIDKMKLLPLLDTSIFTVLVIFHKIYLKKDFLTVPFV